MPRRTKRAVTKKPAKKAAQRPGAGVDRTLIRQMLALTPAERLRFAVGSSRNMVELLSRTRQK